MRSTVSRRYEKQFRIPFYFNIERQSVQSIQRSNVLVTFLS